MNTAQILLAEDNAGDILLIREALAMHAVRHELHLVRDGGEALDYIARMGEPGEVPCPDLLLLDLNLPKVDGPEVLSEFRKTPQCAHSPVIVITSSDAIADRDRMAALGVTCYFRKPSDLDQFLELGSIIRQVLDVSQIMTTP